MSKQSFADKIYLGLTGEVNADWQKKLEEINELGIEEIAVFLERFDCKERDNFYKFFTRSSIKKVPFVHLRHSVGVDEVKFFIENYGTRHFNIHEESFDILDKWKGYWDKLYLEMNYDGKIAKNVEVKRIGGFCVDLAHFKTAIARGKEEAYYIYMQRNKMKFACNHLSGYTEKKTRDLHVVRNFKDFDYLTTLPKYVFSEIIALEVDNSIKEQIKYKEYIAKLLDNYFK